MKRFWFSFRVVGGLSLISIGIATVVLSILVLTGNDTRGMIIALGSLAICSTLLLFWFMWNFATLSTQFMKLWKAIEESINKNKKEG